MKSWDEIVRDMEKHRMANEEPQTGNIAVGDKVEAPRHGIGKVLAIVGDNAWVQTPVRDYPLTFDVRKLRKVSKPRQWRFDVLSRTGRGVEYGVESVELTAEVRERLKDLL